MSRRLSKRSNTGSSEVASSSCRGGIQAPPPALVEDEEERIDPDADVFQTFVPAVSPDPEVAINDGKLAGKYSEIYNNIRALGFDSLFCPGDAVNASLDTVYEVRVWGKVIPFSSQVINQIMGFTEHSHKFFQRFLRWPDYPAIHRQLCGADSSAAWTRDANEFHMDMKKGTFQRPARVVLHMDKVRPLGARRLHYSSMITRLLRAHHVEEEFHYERTILVSYPIKAYDVMSVIYPHAATVNSNQRLVRVEETLQLLFADLRLHHPLSAITQQWLGLARGGQLPPDEDMNSIPSDDEEYLRTFEGADD
ncbi:hypothetical protein A4A49_52562 [Nicotiana attenuata]|uniref:Uncharacterized protein n=1 Tax=Nicotiana attenuata TaxID=49451 RepID=A0A314KHR1_NICAT|nr:hypothetical protein A4A49_52562 [Nicotiana attenuata]